MKKLFKVFIETEAIVEAENLDEACELALFDGMYMWAESFVNDEKTRSANGEELK